MRSRLVKSFATALLCGLSITGTLRADDTVPGLASANAALQEGRADEALSILGSLPVSADAHNLKCRVHFVLEHWGIAASECEQAVNLEQGKSDFHLWLGRSLGEEADKASFVNAYSLAKRARAEFEQAVQLNPRNAEALADLGEFYSAAPGIVGGGLDKAEGVAAQLDKVDPARANQLRGAIASERKDYATAENQIKQAIAVSAHPAFQWMTLASFYRRRQQWTEMENAVQNGFHAAEHDKHAGVALFNGASVLIKANRNPELAATMLKSYLSGTSKTEEAPAFVAHVWLSRLNAALGNPAGAHAERSAALAMASTYKPAEDLKN